MISISRWITGVSMASIALTLYYFDCPEILLCLCLAASLWDMQYAYFVHNNTDLVVLHYFNILAQIRMYKLYLIDPVTVGQIIIISQMSDAFQCIFGKYLGKTTIGWPSPNKTVEGYVFGGIASILFSMWLGQSLLYSILFYVIGCLGGYLSSVIKRKYGIKDHSNLLGQHGGWADRIDSFVLIAWIFRLS